METFKITSKEFLLLCTGLGATDVYGVDDAYSDLDENDISKEIRRVQHSLESKGYIQSDFDGNSAIRDDLLALIKVCALCESFIAVDCQKKNGEIKNVMYYLLKDRIVKSVKQNGEYIINEFDKSNVLSDVNSIINIDPIEKEWSFEEVHISVKEMDSIKEYINAGNRESAIQLMKNKFDETISNIILNCLEKKEDFYSITTVDFRRKTDGVHNVMFINADKCSIKMTPIVIDLIDEIEFSTITLDMVNELINTYLESILMNAEDGE